MQILSGTNIISFFFIRYDILTMFTEGAYSTFKSIFHKALKDNIISFKFCFEKYPYYCYKYQIISLEY